MIVYKFVKPSLYFGSLVELSWIFQLGIQIILPARESYCNLGVLEQEMLRNFY